MKCLEKDRTRRYETANGLAVDIQRHLENEPVAACPPSPMYRLQKLIRRNKVAVAATSAVAIALFIGLGLSTWLWLAERRARRQKDAVIKLFIEGQVTRTALPREHRPVDRSETNRIPWLVPPGDPRLQGKTYEQWAAAWFKWGLEMPVTNSAGAVHPFKDSPRFDIASGQNAEVWFLGAPFGKVRRTGVVPAGKSLFFPLFSVECSNLEENAFYGATANEQSAKAQWWTDHVVDLFFEINGIRLSDPSAYRTQSPQITFSAPAPWIQGERGGIGTACGDGYFVYLSPLPPGRHVLRFGGTLNLTEAQDGFEEHRSIDITYELTVEGGLAPGTAK
jgi:hypothetical protein